MAKADNDFTKGSIPRNILSMALPMTLAQIINLLYNIVDRYLYRQDSGRRDAGADRTGTDHFQSLRY